HISSAFTDKDGKFKLETTMNYAPSGLRLEVFHQCKESREEKMDGKGEKGWKRLPLKYGDRRVYDVGTIDSSDERWNWARETRQIEGVEYQGDDLAPEMGKVK
ncbi:hypothetical protein PMAYCL1PPCAC_12919, partial [Pristionchus mayeri]